MGLLLRRSHRHSADAGLPLTQTGQHDSLGGADELYESLSEEDESELVPSEESEVGSGSDPDGFWDFL